MSWIVRWLIKLCLDMMADIFGLIGDMSSVGFSNDVVVAIMSGFKIIGFPLVGIAILSFMFKTVCQHHGWPADQYRKYSSKGHIRSGRL